MCRKHINSLGDIFVLHMDNNTIEHTKSFQHCTDSWENWGSYLYFWMFLKESSWDKSIFLLNANIIKKKGVYGKHPQESWWLPAAVPPRTGFCANPRFVLWVYHHINVLEMGLHACAFFSSHFISENVCFSSGFLTKSYNYGDGHRLASSPCQVDLDSPGGTLCHGRLLCMCI